MMLHCSLSFRDEKGDVALLCLAFWGRESSF